MNYKQIRTFKSKYANPHIYFFKNKKKKKPASWQFEAADLKDKKSKIL
jgi:hypothetical protein